MHTALTIDIARLHQQALDTGKPFKQVVHETLRAVPEQPVSASGRHMPVMQQPASTSIT